MESEVRQALQEIGDRRLIPRIWARDHTAWKPEPEEIVNRLGWLTVPVFAEQQVPAMRAAAQAARRRGVRDVVLLGMGGSSLAPEVLRLIFGAQRGCLACMSSTRPSPAGWRRWSGRSSLAARCSWSRASPAARSKSSPSFATSST